MLELPLLCWHAPSASILASIRLLAKNVRLKQAAGFTTLCMLCLQGDDSYDGVQYQRDFAPQAGQWQVVDLPWDSFKPNLRGQMIPNRPPIRGQQVWGYAC